MANKIELNLNHDTHFLVDLYFEQSLISKTPQIKEKIFKWGKDFFRQLKGPKSRENWTKIKKIENYYPISVEKSENSSKIEYKISENLESILKASSFYQGVLKEADNTYGLNYGFKDNQNIKNGQKNVLNKITSNLFKEFQEERREESFCTAKLSFINKKFLQEHQTFYLKMSGLSLGSSISKKINHITFDEYLSEIKDLVSFIGLGSPKLTGDKDSTINIELKSSPLSNKGLGEKTGYFLVGFFEGLLKSFSQTSWSVVERKCRSIGNDKCLYACRNL